MYLVIESIQSNTQSAFVKGGTLRCNLVYGEGSSTTINFDLEKGLYRVHVLANG